MSVKNPSFGSCFFPVPPDDWTAEAILQTDELVRPLPGFAQCLKIIGGLGALYTSYKVAVCLFSAAALSSTVVLVGITSFVLVALGMGFGRLAASHYEGLTEEHRLDIALEELKAAFDELPVFDSEDELQQRLADDLEFDTNIAITILEKANKICFLAFGHYRPTKQLQPRLEIMSYKLSFEQQKDLLEAAYQKGIILELASYSSNLFSVPLPDTPGIKLDRKQYGQTMIEKVQQGAKLAVDFLEKCLAGQDSDTIDIKQINTQLYALGYKFEKNKRQHILNPIVYMESEETLVIRGNFSEIDDLFAVIDRLAPHVKNVKIERQGLLFNTIPSLVQNHNWINFQNSLNDSYPGKMLFVDELDDMPDIWQTAVYQKPGLKEKWEDGKEDSARRQMQKKN